MSAREVLIVVVVVVLAMWGSACHANPEAAPLPGVGSAVEAFPKVHEVLREQRWASAGSMEGALKDVEATMGLQHVAMLREVYQGRRWEPALQSGSIPSSEAEGWLEALRGSRRDGIEGSAVHVEEAEALMGRLKELKQELEALEAEAPSPTAAEAERLRGLYAQEPSPSAEGVLEALRGAGEAPGGLRGWHERVVELRGRAVSEAAKLEVVLGDGLLHYVKLLGLGQAGRYTEAQLISPGLEAVSQEALKGALKELLGGASPEAMVARLRPESEQYEKLMRGLERYEALARQGGWGVELPYLSKGKRGKPINYTRKTAEIPEGVVRQLKVRLKAEGFYEGEVDGDAWGDDFEGALLAYQESHQFDTKQGEVDYELLESMRVPVEYRVAQIKSSLKRLRESQIRDYKGYFVLVNLPDFHAEVWDQGKREMRFRVVVGSAEKQFNKETKQWEFPNATPRFSDVMETIILNPPWTVPPRIRRELERKLSKDPEYYEKNGYELVPTGGGDVLRQKPGDGNALGKVKFLFPNDDDIYMHDTPSKQYFKQAYRAQSHGCMRVQDPLDLAYFLLKRDDPSITEKQVKGAAASGKQFRYQLKRGPAVHIEYRTVRVDEEGKVYFLADIYELDKQLIEQEYGLTYEKRP